MSTVLQSSIAVGQQRAVLLTSNKSQLFRIDLAAAAGSSQQGAQLSLINAATGESIKSLGTIAGGSDSMFVWLPAGEYHLVVSGISRDESAMPALGFTLKADVISADEGPGIDDGSSPPTSEEDTYTTTVLPDFDPGVSVGDLSEDPWEDNLLLNAIQQFALLLLGP
jgi:hypothetical protein